MFAFVYVSPNPSLSRDNEFIVGRHWKLVFLTTFISEVLNYLSLSNNGRCTRLKRIFFLHSKNELILKYTEGKPLVRSQQVCYFLYNFYLNQLSATSLACKQQTSLRKQPFLLAVRRWGRFARHNVRSSGRLFSPFFDLIGHHQNKRSYVTESFCRSGSQMLFFVFFGGREATTGNTSAVRRLRLPTPHVFRAPRPPCACLRSNKKCEKKRLFCSVKQKPTVCLALGKVWGEFNLANGRFGEKLIFATCNDWFFFIYGTQ